MQVKPCRKNSLHTSKFVPGDMKYVLNLTIDMPYFSKCFLPQKNSRQHSPNQVHQNVHVSIGPYTKKSKNSQIINRSSTVSQRAKKYSNLTTITKPSFLATAKQTIINAKKKKKAKSIDKKPFKIISVLNLLQRDPDESVNVIRYDNSRNQHFDKAVSEKRHKILQQQQTNRKDQNIRIESNSSDFRLLNVLEMRKLQELASNKHELANSQYLRQKFIINNSVRKIQRAWRRYRTKKLIKSYSSSQDNNFNFCQKNATRSAEKNFFTKKNRKIHFRQKQLKYSELSPSNPQNNRIDNIQVNPTSTTMPIVYDDSNDKKKAQQKIMKKLKQFQQQEINEDGKISSNIQQILKNVLLSKVKMNQAQSYQLQQSQLEKSNDSKKSENQVFNLKKIQYFQEAIQKIDNQNSDISSTSLTPDKLYELERIENQQINNKLQHIEQIKDKGFSEQKQIVRSSFEQQKKQKISLRNLNKQKKSIQSNQKIQTQQKKTSKQILFNLNRLDKQQQSLQRQNSKFPQQLVKRIQKLSIMQQLQICKLIGDKLIYQSAVEYSKSSVISTKIKQILPKQTNNSKQQPSKKQQAQSSNVLQGICTNLQAMKDYLENFVSYLLQYQKDLLKNNLQTSTGPTPQILLKYFRRSNDEELDYIGNNYVIPFKYFQQHWKQAVDQIYFDPKYLENQQKQQQRVRYLKGITKIFFRSIFDAFNEALDHERVFGIMGKPYPWKIQLKIQHPIHIKNSLVLAYKRMASLAQVSCGILIDNCKKQIPEQLLNEIHQAKLNKLLQIEMLQENIRWQFLEDQLAQVKYELSECIFSKVISQILKQLVLLQDFYREL